MHFKFNVTEGLWFIEWVVMRRKHIKAQEEIDILKKEKQELRSEVNALKLRVQELIKSKRNFGMNMNDEFDKKATEERERLINEFNKKNNKGRNYRKKRKNRF